MAYVFAVADDDACNTVSAHGVKGCTHIVLVLHPNIVVVPAPISVTRFHSL